MFRLFVIIIIVIQSYCALAKSPHGDKLAIDCSACHNSQDWTVKIDNISFNHSKTSFALIGQHSKQNCRKCHIDLIFSNAKSTCASCHIDVHQLTVGQDCERCHAPRSWILVNVPEIHQKSRFPLTGQHEKVDCYQCHKSANLLRYDPMGTQCVDCHITQFSATTQPSHVTATFPTDCFMCHTVSGWQQTKFDHNVTFPLTGSHSNVACASCHTNGYTGGTPTTCNACHAANYTASTNPNHTSAKFSTDCKTCHTPTAWAPSSFNHTTATTFPLTGSHIGVTCISCHSKGYAGIPTDCVSCHQTDFNATTAPAHVAGKFPTDCKLCHTTTLWTTATFNHNTTTVFPLIGAHTTVACATCHTNGYTGGTPTECVGCHLTNFNASVSPNHVLAKFPTDCKICHTTTAWIPNSFNHNTATTFPLTGSHIGVDCINCHSTGYIGISTACVSCHQNNYNASTSPAHLVAKFPTDCKICHTTTAWVPSTFNHTTGTTFPLTGAHIGVTCISCHTLGYAGISMLCVSCHLTEFNTTNNPAHAIAKFPTNCEFCHTVTVWTTTTYNHDSQYFPINSGSHQGKWTLCTQCHTTVTNFAIFNCLVCHPQTTMASAHKGRTGYAYNSANCYSCHPRGKT